MPDASVTADDVAESVRLTTTTLRELPDADWAAPAGPLAWTCWETVEHIADNLFFHAAQLGAGATDPGRPAPFAWARHRDGGPGLVIFADRAAGPAGLLRVVEACGALLVAVVRTTPPGVRAHHDEGVLDAAGFAALTVGETLVHMHDVATGLGFSWSPPAGLCDRVLARFFPGAPADADRWATLLWATGRGELPGVPRRTAWSWGAQPSG